MFVHVSLGKDAISPIKLTKAEVKAVIPNADTFPIAIVDLLVGVTRRVAIVPLSFSPAIDSEQIPIAPENKNVISRNGSIIVKILTVKASYLAKSYFVSP